MDKEYHKKYYQEHKENWKECNKNRKEYMREYRIENKEKIRQKDRECHQRLKIEVLTHYGQGRLRCVRCGFDDDFHALSLDHIDGGGEEDRRKFGAGVSFFYYLRRNNYPTGFQTLCMNCQFIKAWENKEFSNQSAVGYWEKPYENKP